MKVFLITLLIGACLIFGISCNAPSQKAGSNPGTANTPGGKENPTIGEITPSLGSAEPVQESPPEVGKPPADIMFTDAGGKQFKLSSLKGKVVVLDFWATWCGPCLKELPHLARLDKEYREKGLVLIGIATQSDPKEIPRLIREDGVGYQIYLDSGDRTATAWEVPAFPSLVLIGKDGMVAANVVGARSYEILQAIVEDVLAGRPPKETEFPA